MSIISSNHIDIKSNSIWGLYSISIWLLHDWKRSIFYDKESRELLEKHGYIEVNDKEVLIKKHQDLDLYSKDPRNPFCIIDELETDPFILREHTTIEELQSWLYKNIVKTTSKRNLDPSDLQFISFKYNPKDYIKFES